MVISSNPTVTEGLSNLNDVMPNAIFMNEYFAVKKRTEMMRLYRYMAVFLHTHLRVALSDG